MGLKYITSSSGKPSASLTMAMVSFVLTTGWLLFWLIGTTFGLHVPAFDATVAMGYMSPLLALYFGRRWTEGGSPEAGDSNSSEQSSIEDEIEEEETQTEPIITENEDVIASEEQTPTTSTKSNNRKKKK